MAVLTNQYEMEGEMNSKTNMTTTTKNNKKKTQNNNIDDHGDSRMHVENALLHGAEAAMDNIEEKTLVMRPSQPTVNHQGDDDDDDGTNNNNDDDDDGEGMHRNDSTV